MLVIKYKKRKFNVLLMDDKYYYCNEILKDNMVSKIIKKIVVERVKDVQKSSKKSK